MLNQFQLDSGEFLEALYVEYDEENETYSQDKILFSFRQYDKSGRGVATGQDNVLTTYIGGVLSGKEKFSIYTTANLPFKPMDDIILKNLGENGKDIGKTIKEVGVVRSSANNMAMSQFIGMSQYSPKVLELE